MDSSRSFAWRPRTTIILLGGFAIVLIALTISYTLRTFNAAISVHVGAGFYSVGLANTEKERTRGLSGVASLPHNGGLLFDFRENGRWGIWMKDMQFPLDIVWLSDTKQVVYIKQNADHTLGTEVTYTPTADARYVLELPAGSVADASIRLGTYAQFDIGDKQE